MTTRSVHCLLVKSLFFFFFFSDFPRVYRRREGLFPQGDDQTRLDAYYGIEKNVSDFVSLPLMRIWDKIWVYLVWGGGGV